MFSAIGMRATLLPALSFLVLGTAYAAETDYTPGEDLQPILKIEW